MIRIVLGKFINVFLLWLHIKKYRKNNLHNSTTPSNLFRIEKVKVGNYSYGFINLTDHANSDSILQIGNFCSIAPDVKFLLGGDHKIGNISTYPFKAKFGLVENEAVGKGSIIIKDDVWVGANCLILSGVTVNQGAILAAGSIVTKDVPAYAIVAGNPAKVIKYRHSPELINKLNSIDYSNLTRKEVLENIKPWYEGLDEFNIDRIVRSIFKI